MFTRKSTQADVVELSLRDGVPPSMALPNSFDLKARKAQAEDQARIDATSGAYDHIAVEALPTLPYEQLIDHEIQMLQRSAAESLSTLPAGDLEPTAAARQTDARLRLEQGLLDTEREKRREISRVLSGEERTHDEVDWSGTDGIVTSASESTRYCTIIIAWPRSSSAWA